MAGQISAQEEQVKATCIVNSAAADVQSRNPAGAAQLPFVAPARAQAHEASTCSRSIICVSSTLCEFFDHRLGRSRAAREDLAFARWSNHRSQILDGWIDR